MKFNIEDLKFNEQGLIPCITQDAGTLEVLMMAWMNKEAIEATISSGRVTYWSRSRGALWVKGETSGNTQALQAFRYDCDSDCVLALVKQIGPACHTNRRSCFYREVQNGEIKEIMSPI